MRRIVLSLLVAALIVLAGCGGAPSKSSFLAEADDTCRAANAPVASLKTPTSFPELADGARAVAAASDEQVPRLRDLDRPSGAKDQTDAVFNSIAGVAASARSLQAAADGKDEKATAQSANEVSAQARQAGDGARAYGFTTCGSSTQTAATSLTDGARTVVKASFVLKGEASCRKALKEAEGLPEPRSTAQQGRFFDSFLRIYDVVLSELRANVVPPGDEAAVSELIDAQQRLRDKFKEFRDTVPRGNERVLAALLQEISVLNTAANAKADAYGIKACGTLAE